MTRTKRSMVWLVAVLGLFSVLATACGSSSKSSTSSNSSSSSSADTSSSSDSGSGSADTAALKALTGTLSGGGSSFQDTFEQKSIAAFDQQVSDAGGTAVIKYTKSGSSDGKAKLAAGTFEFAGSDSAIKDTEKASFGTKKILYFPIVGGPIAAIYNVKGLTTLRLSPNTLAGIFAGKITSWDAAEIKADNPSATLPATKITVVHRSDGSGTTSNFTKYLTSAAPTVWTLGSGETVQWPSTTQGAEKNTGVTAVVKQTDGAIGYADLADAAKENLDVATIQNKDGKWVAPTPAGASAAMDSAATTAAADLTYNPINQSGAAAYPITSPTWILVDASQPSAAKAALVKAYLNYILTAGQSQAKTLFYAPLPASLQAKAQAQLSQITSA